MHTDVEDHRGNDKMNDKIDKLKKKNPKHEDNISWSGGIRMGEELPDRLNISKVLFLKLSNGFL